MKIIQVINFNICKNWLLEKKGFLKLKGWVFPKNGLFSFAISGLVIMYVEGGRGEGKYVGKIKMSVSLLQTI